MGEPPPPPPGAPLLLLLLSLAGRGRGQLHLGKGLLHKEQLRLGGIQPVPLQESKAVWDDHGRAARRSIPVSRRANRQLRALRVASKNHLPRDLLRSLKQRFRYWKNLPVAARKLQALSRHRRTSLWLGPPPRPTHPPGSTRLAERSRPAQDREGGAPQALPSLREEEEEGAVKPDDPGTPPDSPASPGAPSRQQPLPPSFTEAGVVLHPAACRCPGSGRPPLPAQLQKEAEGPRGGPRVPTPRTEEAAWAASALTFLLVVLTLAVLYTRLHRKCRRGPSLYWRASSEEGQETVAVLKRHLFPQRRRKKRPRRQQQAQPLLSGSSSGDSA